MEKFLPVSFKDFFETGLPFPNPDKLSREWGNKQFAQHQMLYTAQHVVERMVIRCDIFIPISNDAYLEQLRTHLRKLLCMLKYALDNGDRWKTENIDYLELCAYIDNELLKAYPDENHIPETIPA
jgi:hypothetical protein